MIKWELRIDIDGYERYISENNSSHFKSEENKIKYIRKEINRYLKSIIEKDKE